jgi:hypothetical protein
MLRAACSAPSTFIAELERSAELSESLFDYRKWRTKVGDFFCVIVGMPILGPRSNFGAPFGLRGARVEAASGGRNRIGVVHAESEFGIAK